MLLAEDEFLIAEDLAWALSAVGATVIGPAYSVAGALGLIETCGALDGAVLDVNLKGEAAFPVADALLGRGVPFVFTTGYDRQSVQRAVQEDVVRFEKPVDPAKLVAVAVAGEARTIACAWISAGMCMTSIIGMSTKG